MTTNDPFVIRRPEPHEMRAAANTMRAALLHGPADDAEWEKWHAGWEQGYFGVTAWEGEACVGNAGAFHFDTLVPGGGWLPTSGVTRVGVLPTHSRRGLLTRMMHLLLTEERAAGRVLTSLRASEAPIYGRFGYGLAGEAVAVLVETSRLRPIRGSAGGSCRLLRPDQIMSTVPAIYERIHHRVGAATRDTWMWTRTLAAAIEAKKADHIVVHTSPEGVDDGYASYSVEWMDGEFAEIGGKGALQELFADSAAVELALWDFLVNIGLLRTIACDSRPVDDVVRLVVHDYRGYHVKRRWDEQWLRLLDVEVALAARVYGEGAAVTIDVHDPMFPDNEGTYRVGSDGAARTTAAPELSAPIDALSATYLGSVSWRDLLAVGRVQGTVDAARRADDLFRHTPATYCGTFF